MGKIGAHVQEYIGRYVVIASVVLAPAAGLVATAAAKLGGVDTQLGRALTFVAGALATGAAIGVWLRNLGVWETAPIAAQTAATTAAAAAAGAAAGASGAVPAVGLEDPEVAGIPLHDLPSDDVEFSAPPPPAPDETNAPVQPSQAGLTGDTPAGS